jgi:polyhydroxybutyrate depolymerase
MHRLVAPLCVAIVISVARLHAADASPQELTLSVGDLSRTAIVYARSNAAESPRPVVFAFHGHGGTARTSAARWRYHELWPEAVCVYPQGVPTPGRLTDAEGKRNGWQHAAGDHEDRDLKFFDALLAKLKADYKIDEKRIYCTGHSNGGSFTYLLWAERGDVFAAVAPSASAALRVGRELKPKPALHLAGENDPLVKYAWQTLTIDRIRKTNGCEESGKPAGEFCTEYASVGGTPVVTFIHPGGHEFPAGAAERFVRFFKQHKLK